MKHDWILDVLTDLTTFARDNGLRDLAEHLDDAQIVAAQAMVRQHALARVVPSECVCGDYVEGVRDGL